MKALLISYLAVAALALGTQVMAYMSHKMSQRKH